MIFILGLVIASLLTALALQIFPRINLLDFPERYGLHRARLPYPGGLIFLFLALGALLWQEQWVIAGITLILGLMSFWDDKTDLPGSARLLLHVIFAAIVFDLGIRIAFVGNPFDPGTSINLMTWPAMSLVLTILWIVTIQNALNWFDGIQGSAVGVSGIGFLALGLFGIFRPEVAWEAHLPEFLNLTWFLSGCCFGAFLFFWKGKIILGDTGAQVLGFLLAILSIFAGTKIATTLLILGLPLLDFVFVILRRIFIDKKSPFKGDQSHLPQRLAQKFGEPKACLLLVSFSAILGATSIFLTGTHKILALLLILLLISKPILSKR